MLLGVNIEQRLMLELLSYSVCHRPVTRELFDGINSDTIGALYDLSRKHGLAHIAGSALEENFLFPEGCGEYENVFFKSRLFALNRYEQMKYALDEIGKAFESAEIKYIPLKGAVLREYYPEPWMRSSCDTDILVRESEIDHAVSCLKEVLGYRFVGKGSHDISLYSPGGLHLELHYSLNDPGFGKFPLIDSVWEYAGPDADNKFLYRMSDELFYYYHIVHMAKHFVNGGCGVRSFLDLWIMLHRMDEPNNIRTLVAGDGLYAFEEASVRLSETWFSGESQTEITEAMGKYIFTGGVYGSLANTISVKRTKNRSGFRYVLSRIFLPYDKLKYIYPVLFEHRWLTPFCEVCRWFRLILMGGAGRSVNEFRINRRISSEKIASVGKLLDVLELNKI